MTLHEHSPPRDVHRRIWTIAWPMTLSSISTPLLGIVDTALLGHLGSAHYLAAVAIGANFIGLLYWSFGFLRMGTTGQTAQWYGRRRDASAQVRDKIDAVLLRAIAVGAVLGIAITLSTPFLSAQVVSWMNASEVSAPLAQQYIDIRRLSAPLVFITFAISGWLIGTQQPRRALTIIITMNALNIIFDLLFIVHFDMASAGAAWATLIAETAAFVMACYFLKNHSGVLTVSRWQSWLKKSELLAMLRVNYYLLVRTIILMLVFNYFTAQGAAFGDNTLAANAIILQLFFFAVFVMDGISYSAEALCGESYGSKDFVLFRRMIFYCGQWELVAALTFSAVYLLFGTTIIEIFSDVDAVIDSAASSRAWLIALPLAGFMAYLLDGVCIGAGQTRAMYHSILISTLAVFLPLWLLSKACLANHGLWMAFTAFNCARGLYLIVFWKNFLAKQE